ncbi:unnamed protein product [Didymodactylos carnosus]|uniref:Uncharacterized protein n=1 Tax=Didymodactylos carnosus TaxID=1234261 RepID=A0A814CD42_9BILA
MRQRTNSRGRGKSKLIPVRGQGQKRGRPPRRRGLTIRANIKQRRTNNDDLEVDDGNDQSNMEVNQENNENEEMEEENREKLNCSDQRPAINRVSIEVSDDENDQNQPTTSASTTPKPKSKPSTKSYFKLIAPNTYQCKLCEK